MHPVTNSSLVRVPSLLVSSLSKIISTLSLNWLVLISIKCRDGDSKDPAEEAITHIYRYNTVELQIKRWNLSN